MAWSKQCAGLLLLAIAIQFFLVNGSETFKNLKSQFKVGKKILKLAKEIWNGVDYIITITSDVPESGGSLYKPPDDSMQRDVTDSLRYLVTKNDDIKIAMLDTNNKIINKITEEVPAMIELNRRLSQIFINSVHIHEKYKTFVAYHQNPEKYDKTMLKGFANTALYKSNGVTSLLRDTYTHLVLGDSSSISTVQLLTNNMELFLQYAKVLKTPQQFLHDILQATLYNEVKGYLIVRYSYKILQLIDDWEDYNFEIETVDNDFAERINKTVDIFTAAMTAASRELIRFNPTEHKEGVTYAELKHVFQEFIMNERDLSPGDACKNTCSDYRITDSKALNGCFYTREICAITRCDGYLYDCRKKVDTKMYICPTHMGDSRRYDFIDFANGAAHYGQKAEKCWADPIKTKASHLFLFWSCDSCMCVCADTSTQSERFFNLQPSMANISDNYFVTGARLVKKNRIIHIQIQEGQLLSNGFVNSSTLRWVPFNENPTQYHILAWENDREVNLDDLHAPRNYVLTGLSFTPVTINGVKRRLHLKIFAAPVDFETGSLSVGAQEESVNKSAEDEIKLKDVDVPTRTKVVTATRSYPGQFLKFSPTGLEKDVGQSTIPFIDLQEVISSPSTPMSGAGIYHKRRLDNGGFLALKLFSYDYVQNLNSNVEI